MNKSGFTNVVAVIVVVLLVGLTVYFGYLAFTKTRTGDVTPTPDSSDSTGNTDKDTDYSTKYKTYSDSELEFDYPAVLSLKKSADSIILSHSTVYKHPDPCDFKGDAGELNNLYDFDVSIKIFNEDLRGTLPDNEGSEDILKYLKGGTLTLSEGFIDKFDVGFLAGFQVTTGVEGCGRYSYYFPISKDATLVVNRSFIPEFNPINENYKTYPGLPGIITPDQEKEFFMKMMASLKIQG